MAMGGNRMTDQLEQIRQDALSIVRVALEWELSSTRWDGIAASLVALMAALDAGKP